MEKCSSCESARELDLLISRLNMLKGTYYTKPCIEGYCLGLFTPHTSRIQRRIEAFKEERKVHEQDCHDFLREKDCIENQRKQETKLANDREIEKIKIDSNEAIAKAEIEAMKYSEESTHTLKRGHLFRR